MQAGNAPGIRVLGHVIVGDNDDVSVRDRGLILHPREPARALAPTTKHSDLMLILITATIAARVLLILVLLLASIIFSPLLKRTAHIESISSHLDIAPSLLAFLKKNYRLDNPSLAPWVGSGLDTDSSFRNIHSYPLKHTKTNLIDYISGMFFIDQELCFP